jgi:hypothetical protein
MAYRLSKEESHSRNQGYKPIVKKGRGYHLKRPAALSAATGARRSNTQVIITVGTME